MHESQEAPDPNATGAFNLPGEQPGTHSASGDHDLRGPPRHATLENAHRGATGAVDRASGVRILRVDLSGIRQADVLRREPDRIRPLVSVLSLTILRSTHLSCERLPGLREAAARIAPHVRARALVGLPGNRIHGATLVRATHGAGHAELPHGGSKGLAGGAGRNGCFRTRERHR